MSRRKKINSSRVNLVISLLFHSLALGAIFFFAGREGMLGQKVKELTVSLGPKEKKPEPPKPKPAEPKPDVPKPAETPRAVAPPPRVETANTPPPAREDAPVVAPPPVSLPAFDFNDGAEEVQTTADANELYKALIERALRARWNRPEDLPDDQFTAQVELSVAPDGTIRAWQWQKGSGNRRWDDSVKLALNQTKTISRPPPKGFPDKFVVRFDVETTTEPEMQVSSR